MGFNYNNNTNLSIGMGISSGIPSILKGINCRKVLIATGRHVGETDFVKKVVESIEEEKIRTIIYKKISNEPTIEQVNESADFLRQSGADSVVAIGGGSVLDAAKAMCILQTNEGSIGEYLFGGNKTIEARPMPLIAVPTTAGTGSEVTRFAVISDVKNQVKLSVAHPYVLPEYAVVDPAFTVGTSAFITATTGMDALTHAIESYVSLNANPISEALSLKAIKLIGDNIRTAVNNGDNLQARYNMAVGSTIAGLAFDNAGLGAVHGLAQSLGGIVKISHGAANSLFLPYVMKRNMIGNLEKFKNIAIALGQNVEKLSLREAASKSVSAVSSIADDLPVPTKLSSNEVNLNSEYFPKIIEDTLNYRQLAINPCKLNAEDIENILKDAFN